MMDEFPAPAHGGNIYQASKEFEIPVENWIDLSAGISTRPYPFSPVSQNAYRQLPYCDPVLIQIAKKYYQTIDVLPVAGSQQVIQLLPDILKQGNLWVPKVGYQEYAYQWTKKGRKVFSYPSFFKEETVDVITRAIEQGAVDHLLVINPNNPTGLILPTPILLKWSKQLQARDGMLIIDEAFMDIHPEESIFKLGKSLPDNLIVLRSFGKFFGLAGIRIGFVSAAADFLKIIQSCLGPWCVNGVAQDIAIEALNDSQWHNRMRKKIQADNSKTLELFTPILAQYCGGLFAQKGLFITWKLEVDEGKTLYSRLAELGVLVRLISYSNQYCLIRIGNAYPLTTDSAGSLPDRLSALIKNSP